MQCYPIDVTSLKQLLSFAPCPPPRSVNYQEFHEIARKRSLQDCEIVFLARKCKIHKPGVVTRLTTQWLATDETITPYYGVNVTETGGAAIASAELNVALMVGLIVAIVMFMLLVILVFVLYRYTPYISWMCKKDRKQATVSVPVEKSSNGEEKDTVLSPLDKKPNLTYQKDNDVSAKRISKDLESLLYMDEDDGLIEESQRFIVRTDV